MAGTQLTTAQAVGLGALSGIIGALQGDATPTPANADTTKANFDLSQYMPLVVIAVIAVVVYVAAKKL